MRLGFGELNFLTFVQRWNRCFGKRMEATLHSVRCFHVSTRSVLTSRKRCLARAGSVSDGTISEQLSEELLKSPTIGSRVRTASFTDAGITITTHSVAYVSGSFCALLRLRFRLVRAWIYDSFRSSQSGPTDGGSWAARRRTSVSGSSPTRIRSRCCGRRNFSSTAWPRSRRIGSK